MGGGAATVAAGGVVLHSAILGSGMLVAGSTHGSVQKGEGYNNASIIITHNHGTSTIETYHHIFINIKPYNWIR